MNTDHFDHDYLFKVLLIGDTNVGKTSIVTKITDNDFTNQSKLTIGVDLRIHNFKLANKNIKMQIWDTAGQERFEAITQAYYRGAHGVYLCFNFK